MSFNRPNLSEATPHKTLDVVIYEMNRKGIKKSEAQSKYLENTYGFAILPHVLAEYKWLKWYGNDFSQCVVEIESAWENRAQKDETPLS